MDKQDNDLEQKVNRLEHTVQELQQTMQELYQINNQAISLISQNMVNVGQLDEKLAKETARLENLKFELMDPKGSKELYFFPQIKSVEETIQTILARKMSMARFGDGEFSIIMGKGRAKFQEQDEILQKRLAEVLCSKHPKLLLGIADNYGSLERYTDFAADAIRHYMTEPQTREEHQTLLERERVYYDAYITRPYVIYRDNTTEAPYLRFEQLKRIWQGRNVIIVEGAQTRAGVGNDLFEGANEIKRILAPSVNSFSRYNDILKAALDYATKDTLFLIAMGPAAGVLAYDLTVEGYQALDIGHLDLEYEWFRAGKGERVPVLYKYNNELDGGNVVEDIKDSVYEGQIVASF